MDDWKSRLVIKSMVPHFAMVGNRQEPRKLQESGPTKRRQEGDSFQFPGMADGGYPNKIKRPCLEDVTLSMGPGAHHSTPCAELQVPPLTMNPSPAAMGVPGHPLPLETNPMNGSIMGSPFAVPSAAEMGLKGPSGPYYDKANSMPAVDQELQDLLEELTKIQEPSPNELDLEKILGSKPEEPLVLEHPQPTLGASAKPSVQMPHLESLGSGKEFASSCGQLPGAPLPVPPSPAGLSYVIPASGKQVASPGSSAAQTKSQVQGMLPVALPPLPVPQWHHAHQLKVLAASKQGSATRQPGPNPSWSGLPPPGLSPSYRPVPSPHPPPPPFSPQSLMVSCMASGNLPGSTFQGSPNALLASMASGSSAALGPPVLYTPEKLPSPALNQQPQYSPQSSLLANLVSSSIKSPQGHLMSALPASNPGPSPPYRPEKLSSPGLPQQSFTPQCSLIRSLTPSGNPLSQQQQPPSQQPANTIFKPMATNPPKTLSVIMQQGLASPSPGAPEPFTFGNTKPLSHFVSEPGPQKMPSMPATSRQPSLLHYLQQPTPTPASSATASSTATATLQLQQQPDHSSLLLQQMMQQPPPRFQRPVAPDSMPSLPRQQEKQRSGLMAMTPEQRSAYIAQQMSQFQAVQEQVTSKCNQTDASPPSNQPMMPPRAGLLQNNLSPGMIPPTRHQSHEGMGVISPTPGKQQGIFNSGPLFPVPVRLGQNPLSSLGSVCRRLQIPKATPSRVPLPGFCPRPLSSQPPSPHQLRQPCVPRMPAVFNNAAWAAAAAVTTAVSREPALSRVDNSIQQHFDSNSIFTKAPARVPMVAPTFPPHQAIVPPNQVTPGGRPGHKVSAALVDPSFSPLGNQSLGQSPVQGPVPALNATKSLQQGMASFGPMSPIQGIEPPSYMAAAAATAAASAVAASQSPGPFPRMGNPPEPPPYDFLPQPQLNGLILPPDCSEADFIEALLKGPSASPEEGWVCDLRLIDDILEEHAAAHDAAAQSAGGL
ncbi:mastermind-like domain-containing protein 1 [Panthera tigris]|uniref:mastermind-like domain-containing protein 1 n=1 Tax=Panthera tigris TaxID=9694 RepID=UPI001C6FA9DC|nr:mastermind-like domain-containing protein 1 [Panthera tigris]XP_042831196.1 mastermind-like domain-containing protein 1 [Panthera tigris]